MGTRIHAVETVANTVTLPNWYEDEYLEGADLGACVFDPRRSFSFPKQATAANGDTLRDLMDGSFEPPATPLATGSVVLQSGQTLPFGAGGLDFSGLSFPGSTNNVSAPNVLRMPSRVPALIWGDGSGAVIASPTVTSGAVNNDAVVSVGGSGYDPSQARIVVTGGGGTGAAFSPTFSGGVLTGVTRTAAGSGYATAPTLTLVPAPQYFLAWMWGTLPTDADWNTQAAPLSLITGHESNTGEDAANLVRLNMVNTPTTTGPGFSARIPNIVGSALQLNLNVPSASRGQKALVAVYRINGLSRLYLRTVASGILTSSTNVGQPQRADNIGNFSAKPIDFGVCQPGQINLGSSGSPNAKNFKISRCGIEALRVTGRDPEAVLEAEWQRQVALGIHV